MIIYAYISIRVKRYIAYSMKTQIVGICGNVLLIKINIKNDTKHEVKVQLPLYKLFSLYFYIIYFEWQSQI